MPAGSKDIKVNTVVGVVVEEKDDVRLPKTLPADVSLPLQQILMLQPEVDRLPFDHWLPHCRRRHLQTTSPARAVTPRPPAAAAAMMTRPLSRLAAERSSQGQHQAAAAAAVATSRRTSS
jgi:hypothetical protein